MQRSYGRGFKSNNWHKNQTRTPETPAPLRGKLLKSWNVDELQSEAAVWSEAAKITDTKLLTSYNWLEGGSNESTITIPGTPPRWTPPQIAVQLKEDSGQYFRDKNAARFPKHPMEPTALALLDADPMIRPKLDGVACGSTIGNLLRFVRHGSKTFRILVEIVDGVVFFIRRENSPTELIPDVYGYGHTFPEAYTTWDADVKGSASHQRLIQYSFAGLRFAVRFEGDGYLAEMQDTSSTSGSSNTTSVDDLVPALMAGGVSTQVARGDQVKVKHGGEVVAQNSIFDLKTRSIKKMGDDTLDQEMPRLWVAQIPKFILAYHTRGVFNNIEIKDVRKEVQEWERAHKTELSHLAALMHRVVLEVRTREDGKLELCCDGTGKLEVREQRSEAGDALSMQTRARWVTSGQASPDEEEITWAGSGADEDEDGDYTACSIDCGYCGRCTY